MMFVMVFIYQYIAVGMFFQQTKGLLEHSPDESTDSEVRLTLYYTFSLVYSHPIICLCLFS